MSYKFISLFAAVALLMSACNHLEIQDGSSAESAGQIVTISVSVPETKVTVDEQTGKCSWHSDDKIAVWDSAAGKFAEFALKEGDGTGNAVFEGQMTGSAKGACAVYPASYAVRWSASTGPVLELPSAVQYDPSHERVPAVMKAVVSESAGALEASFSHMAGVIKFTLHDVPAYAAGLQLMSATAGVSGTMDADGKLTDSGAVKKSVVNFPYKTGYDYGNGAADDAVVYVTLPAGSYSDLQVALTDGDGDVIEGSVKNMKSASMLAGQYIVMPRVDFKKNTLRKDYIKVIGIKWAKGNLVRDAENKFHAAEAGVDDGFQAGWGLHDQQWTYINWDSSLGTGGKYSYDNEKYFDLFTWGGLGRQAGYHSGRLVPQTDEFDMQAKVYWGFKNTNAFRPETLTELEGDARFSSETSSNNPAYTLNGTKSGIAGDVAFWASKGKYCMPDRNDILRLSRPKDSDASYQYGKYMVDGKAIYGFLYTTPLGEAVRNVNEVVFTDADLESGLFLPLAGRRMPNTNKEVICQGTEGFYRSSVMGACTNKDYPDHNQCARSIWLGAGVAPVYGFTKTTKEYGSFTTDAYSGNCTLSNAAGGSIRPILYEQSTELPEEEAGPFDAKIGEPLPAWGEGCLDIHAINSGRGECTFFIMPDGTSLCCDAGEIAPSGGTHSRVAPKPNAKTRAYKVYAEYIKHYLPVGETCLDYMLVTHFHNDHMGTPSSSYETVTHDGVTYCKTGVMALYDEVPFRKLIDRVYEEGCTKYPSPEDTGEDVTSKTFHYGFFALRARDYQGMKVERAKVGSKDQLVMVKNPTKYPGFNIIVNAANGEYWNGSASVDPYGSAIPPENGNSIAFLLSYGNFDYYTSGDAGSNTKIALPLIKSINKKIEAMKASHHFSWKTMSLDCMKIFQPKVVVSQSFYDHQPDMGHGWTCNGDDFSGSTNQAFQEAWKAYSSEKYWFFTNVHPVTASTYPDEVAKMKDKDGHVVIRVASNGVFYVYVLDDTDMNYKVKSIHGPYTCHE